MTSRRFGTLDGLRGAAATVVLVGHLSGPFHPYTTHGYLAVDLFFLMSGFVVAGAYEDKLRSGWGVASFLRARLARLWPLYALSFVVGLTCYAVARSLKPDDNFLFPALPLASVVAMGLFFVPQFARYGGGAAFPLNPAAWSLSVEIFGNLIYAAVARSIGNTALKVLVAIGGLGVAMIAFRTGFLNVGVDVDEIAYGYIRYAFSFSLGVLFWRMQAAGTLPRLKVPAGVPLVAAVALMSGLVPESPLYDAGVVLFVFPWVVIAAVTSEPSARFAPLFAWAGAVSYPLYALHEPITGMILTVMPKGAAHVALILALPPVFILGAAAADRWFDRPLQRWLRRRGEPLKAAPAL
ncbi:MAG TPA: acyltransferase [Rhizomicrobium sp.]|nr:acyltransferase [Rhizomicrobium sp.]